MQEQIVPMLLQSPEQQRHRKGKHMTGIELQLQDQGDIKVDPP